MYITWMATSGSKQSTNGVFQLRRRSENKFDIISSSSVSLALFTTPPAEQSIGTSGQKGHGGSVNWASNTPPTIIVRGNISYLSNSLVSRIDSGILRESRAMDLVVADRQTSPRFGAWREMHNAAMRSDLQGR
jgi:hypothetical protein